MRTATSSLLLVILFSVNAYAQRTAKSCVEPYLRKQKTITFYIEQGQRIYGLKKGETLASVGAGSGSKEVIYSMGADSLTIYLGDINMGCLSPETIGATTQTLYGLVNRTNTARFIPVMGAIDKTNLPVASIDKLMIENSLHEFTEADDMLRDIREVLKPTGELFILENIARQEGQRHQGCKRLLFTHQTLVDLLKKHRFQLLRHETVTKESPDYQAYVFRKEE
jgi:ubiquinone/menaquinone biosynthesis C-methylase UbiE